MCGALICFSEDPFLWLFVTGLFFLFVGFTGWAVMVTTVRSLAREVQGRAPGSSDQLHRSGERKHGRSEPLTSPGQKNA
jgi:hypothetical protein